jgi:hypothetical protein
MTRLFIFLLYVHGQSDTNIQKNGMKSLNILHDLRYQAFGESLVPVIVNRLINKSSENN